MGLLKQRVTLTVVLEVDVEGWDADYCNGSSAKDISEDVKAYAQGLLQASNDNWKVVNFK